MTSTREALLELINLQKQEIVRQTVQIRNMAREICAHNTPTYYSVLASEVGDVIRIRGEDWKMLSKNRHERTVTLELMESLGENR